MLFQVVSLLLDVAVGMLAGACLLRLYMQLIRSGFSNPVGAFVFSLTNWMVLPLRRVVPPMGRLDTSSLICAYFLLLAKVVLLVLVAGAEPEAVPTLGWALVGLVRLACSALSALVLAHVLMSWVQTSHLVKAVLERLCDPMLRPIRRVMPSPGGFDLSPLVVLVLLQVAVIILTGSLPTLLR